MKPRPSAVITVLATLLAVGAPSSAQARHQELLDSWTLTVQPLVFASISDLDGDGARDLIVGSPSYPNGPSARGIVFAISSRSDVTLWSRQGIGSEHGLGAPLAPIGDQNGDGVEDLVVGATTLAPSYVLSGVDGAVLLEHQFPIFHAGPVGDVNKDGAADFLMFHYLYLGKSLDLRFFVVGPISSRNVALGDVDGDGVPDFAIGHHESGGKGSPPGDVRAYSGRDGTELWRTEGQESADLFGRSCFTVGDLTGDGVTDVIAASRFHSSATNNRGHAYFLDGVSGVSFDEMHTPQGYLDLAVNWPAGDLNGDGYGDLLASIWRDHPDLDQLQWIVDSRTKRPLFEKSSVGPSIADGDWNGDEFPDYLEGSSSLSGRTLRLYSGAPPGVRMLGGGSSPTTGTGPRIGIDGPGHLGQELRVHLSRVPHGREALLVVGELARAPFPHHPRFASSASVVGPSYHLRTQPIGTGKSGQGTATVTLGVPFDSALVGNHLYAQWIVASGPGGRLETSRILDVQLLDPTETNAAEPLRHEDEIVPR